MFTAVLSEAAKRALADTRFTDVRWVDETGSTNADVMALVRAGAPDGTVVVADHQTAGRGRADRRWEAPPRSSLLVSVLLRPPAATAALCTTALGVAAVDAVAAVAGVSVRLKWPNDLVHPGRGDASDRKLGGILAEADWSDAHRPAVVAGLGLNVNWPDELPGELRDIATALNYVAGRDIDREALLVELLTSLDVVYGHPMLVDAARERSATIGTRVRVTMADGELVGAAVGIGDTGHLVVVDDAGVTHHVVVGDVVHLRPA